MEPIENRIRREMEEKFQDLENKFQEKFLELKNEIKKMKTQPKNDSHKVFFSYKFNANKIVLFSLPWSHPKNLLHYYFFLSKNQKNI